MNTIRPQIMLREALAPFIRRYMPPCQRPGLSLPTFKLNYYVVGLNHDKLLAIREARDKIINKDHPPASALAGVQALFREDVQLEIEAEAVLP